MLESGRGCAECHSGPLQQHNDILVSGDPLLTISSTIETLRWLLSPRASGEAGASPPDVTGGSPPHAPTVTGSARQIITLSSGMQVERLTQGCDTQRTLSAVGGPSVPLFRVLITAISEAAPSMM
jgi:hypothetical protein